MRPKYLLLGQFAGWKKNGLFSVVRQKPANPDMKAWNVAKQLARMRNDDEEKTTMSTIDI